MKKIIFTLSAIFASSIALADAKVIVTDIATKGGSSFSMDIVSQENFKGFQFDIDVAGIEKLDLSACTSRLPSSLTVSCKRIPGDKIRVLAVDISAVGTDVKAGSVAVGVVQYSGSPSLQVSNVVFADKAGEELVSSAVTSK